MEDDLNKQKMEDDFQKNEDDIKIKNLFSIPLKFWANLSWDWLSSLRFLYNFVKVLT
jgi:hypothetical protein